MHLKTLRIYAKLCDLFTLTLEGWTPGATTERQSQIARLTRCQVARAEGTSARNWREQRAASETSATHWLGYTNKAHLRRLLEVALDKRSLLGYLFCDRNRQI
jgi:hypothetical protein